MHLISGGHMKLILVLFALLSIAFAGCEQSARQQQANPELKTETVQKAGEEGKEAAGAFKPFYVFEDKGSRRNHYVPSGFMPSGKCVTFTDTWQDGCREGRTCIKVVYDVECSRKDQKWAGIYWLNPANNWGGRKGGFNLTGAQRLTFWAKGEQGGEQIQEFTVGGITGDYPDSDTAVIGPVILGSEWRRYTVDLRGKDLSYISGGFAWTTSEEVNPRDCAFYLDEIRFE